MWNALGEMYCFSFLVYHYPLFWMISNTMLSARFRLASQSRSAALKVFFMSLLKLRFTKEWMVTIGRLEVSCWFWLWCWPLSRYQLSSCFASFFLKTMSRLLLNDLSNEKTHRKKLEKVHFSKRRQLSKTRERFFFFLSQNLWEQLGFL